MPQYAAGRLTEPAVCVPSASGTMPAATTAAGPALDPPGVWDRSCGLRVGGGPSKYANSVVCALPTNDGAGGAQLRDDLRVDAGCRRLLAGALPARVGKPATSITSLMATGMPCSGPRTLPAARSSLSTSACAARAVAVDDAPALDRVLDRVDPAQARLQHLANAKAPVCDGGRDVQDRAGIRDQRGRAAREAAGLLHIVSRRS